MRRGQPVKNGDWIASERDCRDALAKMMRMPKVEFDKLTKRKECTVAEWATVQFIRRNTAEALARFLPCATPQEWAESSEVDLTQEFVQEDKSLDRFDNPAANA